MDNQFDSKGGSPKATAIGKQENATQEVSGHGNILSGTGNVTVNNHGVPLKPKTVVIASVLAAAVLGASFAGWYLLAPLPAGKSTATTGNNAPAIIAEKGVPPALFAEYTAKLAVTDSALVSFFKIIEQEKVPPGDLDSKLREIAKHYKELLHNWETVQSADPQVVKLKAEAKQAIEAGDYAKAEALLEDVANQHSLAAAEAHADNARLQRVQWRNAKAAAYWQKAAALLPEESKKERALYLYNAAVDLDFDLDRVSRYSEALPLFEQSLVIFREIGDKAGEDMTLNHIGLMYSERGDYITALKYLEQSLRIMQEVGDKASEGTTLNHIGLIYSARGDATTALKYLEQSLRIRQKISDKAGEGTTLNNISQIYDARGDYGTALKYLEQNLVLFREIGAKREEAGTSWNIGCTYKEQGDLRKAEPYMSRAVQLEEEIGHPDLEKDRKALAELRAKLKAR